MKKLKAKGLEFDGKSFGIPDGPCISFSDVSGNSYGIFEETRPGALEKEYKK